VKRKTKEKDWRLAKAMDSPNWTATNSQTVKDSVIAMRKDSNSAIAKLKD
jgi:hypothetical protein